MAPPGVIAAVAANAYILKNICKDMLYERSHGHLARAENPV
jgi:hypothetical protein